MINLHELRYVRLGTRDIDAAAKYAANILGLQLVRREGGWAYLRSDERDHTLVYFEGDPNDQTIAFDVVTNEALEQAGAVLEQNSFRVHAGSRDECDQRRVHAFISFKDPSGNQIELVFGALHSGRRYFPSRDAGITGFSHVGLRTSDPGRDEIFWTKLCNARVSDWIGPAPLLRIDEVHHRIALFPSPFAGIQHINHQVASIDDLMRAWYTLREQGIPIRFGPGRHPTSGAIFLYFEGPDGMTYEYSTGVRLIRPDEEASYCPRRFPFDSTGFCMWGAKPDIPEFQS
ncbi:glyoxalase [Paraburkholderia sp. PGU19]|uniref:VOC family protein n=1 Tax=Paraburkholderia sp. PGU19 TaxID=2735434 RepID=UPI0015DB310A|nr:VOC family protein [Paraburkholderia sp. PGU19]BCF97958.1 glyoxalase [Paraburkholderia sp. PGU19]